MKTLMRRGGLIAALFGVSCVIAACGSDYTGTYTAEGGAMAIELKSGGQATLKTAVGDSPCSWTSSGSTVKLTCGGQSMDLTVNKDGSLSAPLFGTLTKTK